MSSRNLGRHFRSVTGTTPLQWLLTQRIRHAAGAAGDHRRRASTPSPSATGMGTADDAAPALQPQVGVPPDAYRRTFRARTRPAPVPRPRASPSTTTGSPAAGTMAAWQQRATATRPTRS